MRYRIDREALVLNLDLKGAPSAQHALDQSVVLLTAQPELWGWDWIVEAPIVPEGASIEQIAQLARMYAAQPQTLAVSALVSQDRNLHLWARVMDFQFAGRRHLVVQSHDAALRLIETQQARRKMNRK